MIMYDISWWYHNISYLCTVYHCISVHLSYKSLQCFKETWLKRWIFWGRHICCEWPALGCWRTLHRRSRFLQCDLRSGEMHGSAGTVPMIWIPSTDVYRHYRRSVVPFQSLLDRLPIVQSIVRFKHSASCFSSLLCNTKNSKDDPSNLITWQFSTHSID